jgi:hypothetical protein
MNGEPLTGEQRSACKLFEGRDILTGEVIVAKNWDLATLPVIFFAVGLKQAVYA